MTEANRDQNDRLRLLAEQQRSEKFRALGREMELRAEVEIWKLEAAGREMKLKVQLLELEHHALHREAELSSQLQQLNSQLQQLNSQLAQANAQLQQRSAELEATRLQAAARERQLNSEIQSIINSHSWKLTQPLRHATEWVRSRRSPDAGVSPERPASSPEENTNTSDALTAEQPEAPALVSAPSESDSDLPSLALDSQPDPIASPNTELRADALSGADLPDSREEEALDRQAESVDADSFATGGREAWDAAGVARLEELLAGGQRLVLPGSADPKVSIIVLLYNKAALSLLCLQSILKNADVPYELILVDNGSSDNTGRLLEHLDGVEIIRNRENLGFGHGCMQGAERARGEYLCFLNNDAWLCPRSLSVAISDFAEDAAVGVVGGKILFADGSLQEAGSMVWNDGSAWGYGRGDDPDLPRYQFRRPVDYCSGAFLLTARSLFNQLGGFDERFFPAYYEDTDYCFKVWDKGRKVIYEPRAAIRHYESASFGVTEATKELIDAHRAKFAEKWQQQLRRHLPSAGENIPYARTAAQARGTRILYMSDGGPENDLVKDLVAKGHHVTVVSTAQSWQTEHPATDVESVNGLEATHYVFRELLPQYDAAWISGGCSLQDFLRHLRTMYGRVPTVIYEPGAVGLELSGEQATSEAAETEPARRLDEDAALCGAADVVLVVNEPQRELLLAKGVSHVQLRSPESVEQILAEIGTRTY